MSVQSCEGRLLEYYPPIFTSIPPTPLTSGTTVTLGSRLLGNGEYLIYLNHTLTPDSAGEVIDNVLVSIPNGIGFTWNHSIAYGITVPASISPIKNVEAILFRVYDSPTVDNFRIVVSPTFSGGALNYSCGYTIQKIN